jgi:hypothetical protein
LLFLREPTDRAFRRGEGESPAEAGIDTRVMAERLRGQGCAVVSETYLTSWAFIKARHHLERARLQAWERMLWPWRLKLAAELAMDRWGRERLPRLLRGLDAYVVVRRGSVEDRSPVRNGHGSPAALLADVLGCPSCGGELRSDDATPMCASCGTALHINDGIWSFDGSSG